MATYVEMVKFEAEAPAGVIRLVRSGEFYRAYNHSAWLFHTCIADHKVMRKYVKALQENIYYLGFPEKTLLEKAGDRQLTKTEHGYDVALKPDEAPAEEGYETWKAGVATEPASSGDYNSLPLAGADAEREVVRRLRQFPLESKSMMDCAVFVADLRRMLANE